MPSTARSGSFRTSGSGPTAGRKDCRELARVGSADLRDVFVILRKARSQLDRAEYEAVAVARSNRWAWRDVADVLQVAVSTVHKRFARGTALPRRLPG